jgi:hypothetical protein
LTSVLSAFPLGQCIVCSSFWPMHYLLFPLASVLSAFSFGQYFVCSSFWSVYCVLFLLVSVLSALPFGQCIVCSSFLKEEQIIHWPKGRADNKFTKRMSIQYTDQKEEQTIHCPKGRAHKGLAKRKSRQYTGQREERPVLCLLFLLVSVLCALPFGQCIVCSSFWPGYYLLFL